MRKTVCICILFAMACMAYANQPEMVEEKIYIDGQKPAGANTFITSGGENMRLVDPNAATDDVAKIQKKITNVLLVDKHGNGDYTTIQAAIDSINDSSSANPYTVLVTPGVYEEQVTLSKSYIAIVGIQPKGAKITEAKSSGVTIKYQSSGVGDDLMTLWIKSGGATDLAGITIANLTVINTQSLRVGPAQTALDIGRGDTYPRAHEILIKNCSFYGEQDTVFVNTGNPVFRDCYIEGENDDCSIADDAVFERTHFYCHTATTSRSNLWIGRTGDVAFTVTFRECTFDIATGESLRGVGRWGASNATANFYNCTIMPNSAGSTWYEEGYTGTINLYSTNGKGWPSSTNFIEQQKIATSGDATFRGGLNVGTANEAATGEVRASGSVQGSRFKIGNHTVIEPNLLTI